MFTVRGRASRSAYWWFHRRHLPRTFAIVLFTAISPFVFLLLIPLIITSVTVTGRRLHDTGRSAHFLWLFLLPCVGLVRALHPAVLAPKDPNPYGPHWTTPQMPVAYARAGRGATPRPRNQGFRRTQSAVRGLGIPKSHSIDVLLAGSRKNAHGGQPEGWPPWCQAASRRRCASARMASRAALVNSRRSSRLGVGRSRRVRRSCRRAASRAISATTCPRSAGTVSGMPVTVMEPSRWTSTLTVPAMTARSVRTSASRSAPAGC